MILKYIKVYCSLSILNITEVYQSWLNLKHVSFHWSICEKIQHEASLIFLKYIKAMPYVHIYSIHIYL